MTKTKAITDAIDALQAVTTDYQHGEASLAEVAVKALWLLQAIDQPGTLPMEGNKPPWRMPKPTLIASHANGRRLGGRLGVPA